MHLEWPLGADEMTESGEHRFRLLPGVGVTQAHPESPVDKEA